MRKNVTNKEYFFSTIQDMYSFVNSDNIDDFLIDFGSMLKQVVEYREKTIEIAKHLNMTVDPNDIEVKEFSWIDDGEHDDSKGYITINEE